jgi:hypothetical protein
MARSPARWDADPASGDGAKSSRGGRVSLGNFSLLVEEPPHSPGLRRIACQWAWTIVPDGTKMGSVLSGPPPVGIMASLSAMRFMIGKTGCMRRGLCRTARRKGMACRMLQLSSRSPAIAWTSSRSFGVHFGMPCKEHTPYWIPARY